MKTRQPLFVKQKNRLKIIRRFFYINRILFKPILAVLYQQLPEIQLQKLHPIRYHQLTV